MDGQQTYLVYEHRAGDSGREGLRKMSKNELNDILDQNPNLQWSSVPTEGKRSIEIYQRDLYTIAQKDRHWQDFNYNTNIATVDIGLRNSLGYSKLIILSLNKD